jgi:hypothetical protein
MKESSSPEREQKPIKKLKSDPPPGQEQFNLVMDALVNSAIEKQDTKAALTNKLFQLAEEATKFIEGFQEIIGDPTVQAQVEDLQRQGESLFSDVLETWSGSWEEFHRTASAGCWEISQAGDETAAEQMRSLLTLKRQDLQSARERLIAQRITDYTLAVKKCQDACAGRKLELKCPNGAGAGIEETRVSQNALEAEMAQVRGVKHENANGQAGPQNDDDRSLVDLKPREGASGSRFRDQN